MSGCFCAVNLLVGVPANEKDIGGYMIRTWAPEMPQVGKKVEVDFDNPATRVTRLEWREKKLVAKPCRGAGKVSVTVDDIGLSSRALAPPTFFCRFTTNG